MKHEKHAWLIVAVLGAALLLPMLGSYGLWDPAEIQQADLAQEVAKTNSFQDVTVDGQYDRRPVLYVWLVALGLKALGVNELAGRLPMALMALLGMLVAYRVGRRLFSVWAGVAGALVLVSSPVFLFQGRQLASQMPFYVAILAGAGGLAAYLWPVTGRRCAWDLVLGAVGLVAGFLAHGLMLGTLFPLVAVLLAVLLSWRTPGAEQDLPEPEGDDEAETEPPPRPTVGSAVREAMPKLLAALAAAGAVIGVLLATLAGAKTMIMGAPWQRMAMPPTIETVFRDLGWGFYPWFALLPLALAAFVTAQRGSANRRSPDAFGKMLLLVLVVGGYVVCALWQAYFGKILYFVLPWAALAVGVLFVDLCRRSEPVHRVWALLAVGLVLALQQDYFMKPESLAFPHILTHAKYPIELNIKITMRVFGILFAVLFFFALGGVPRAIETYSGTARLAGLWRGLTRLFNTVGGYLRLVLGQRGQHALLGAGALALVFAGWCDFFLVPQLSLHLSNKALFSTFHKCRSGNEMLAQYQVPGRGAAYYNNGQVEEVRDQNHLFELLRQDKRWFILIPSEQLAPIDRAARATAKGGSGAEQSAAKPVSYHVLDDRSSQYLMLSNKLSGVCNKDHNPLKRFVSNKRPRPKHQVLANFENRVQLLGYDLDDVVYRGGKFKITLYFKVLGQMPSGYKIFLHFDQPANRFHGDHVPLGGKYPTEYWLPGDYVSDPHHVEIPLITTPSGSYNIFMGFWLGSGRLKVTEGPNDGVNRVPLGTLRVR